MQVNGLPQNQHDNTPVTRKEIIRSIILFWLFISIWVVGYIVKASAPVVADTTAQWMYGMYGLTRFDSSSLAFKISIVVRLVGLIGTGASLGYYSYLVSSKRRGYWWVGLLALWAPFPAIIGYFIIWWKFKSL